MADNPEMIDLSSPIKDEVEKVLDHATLLLPRSQHKEQRTGGLLGRGDVSGARFFRRNLVSSEIEPPLGPAGVDAEAGAAGGFTSQAQVSDWT